MNRKNIVLVFLIVASFVLISIQSSMADIELISKIAPKNDGFRGMLNSDQLLDASTTAGNILVSDGTYFNNITMSGDATIDQYGVVTVTGGDGDGDPFYNASDAYHVTSALMTNWNTSYGWGNHADIGYLTYHLFGDPFYNASDAYHVTSTLMDHWNTSYGWGDWSGEGFITGWSDGDPFYNASDAYHVTSALMDTWNSSASGNPFDQDLNTTDDVDFKNVDVSDTFNVTGLSEFENDVTVDDASMIIENGAYSWTMNVNATGCMVWEWS